MATGKHWDLNSLCKFTEMKKFTFGLREKSPSNVYLCTNVFYVVIRNLSLFLKVMGHLQSITGIALESIAEFSYAILTHSVEPALQVNSIRSSPPGGPISCAPPTHEAEGIMPNIIAFCHCNLSSLFTFILRWQSSKHLLSCLL